MRKGTLGFAAVLLVLLVAPGAAFAATITVNRTGDLVASDGRCSLREAIRAANLNTTSGGAGECAAGGASDTIVIPPADYQLATPGSGENEALTGDLDLTGVVTLEGAGPAQVTINGGNLDRVLDVQSGRRSPSAA